MSGGRLRVVENESELQDSEDDDVFIVQSELGNVPTSEFEEGFRRVIEREQERVADLPLYGVLRIHFAFLFAQNQCPPMAIPHLVSLYRLLDERVTEQKYDVLKCDGISENYQAVVTDIAAEHSVRVEGAEGFGRRDSIRGFLLGLYGYFRLVVDQMVSVVWKHFRRRPDPTRTVFVPHVNRFDSTRSVLDCLGDDHEVILPIPTVSWLRQRKSNYSELTGYDPTPVDYFASPRRVVETVKRGVLLAWHVMIRQSFEDEVRRFVAEEFDVEMPNTVTYLLGNLYAEHVPSLANTVVAEGMIADLDPEQVVVGSLGSRQQAILYAAIDAGLDTYHVPHSATTGYELAPPPETVHFVPGEHVVEHLHSSAQMSSTENLAPTGRPQLDELERREIQPRKSWDSDRLQVVVATQPFPDSIRTQFVEDVLDALERTAEPADVVVKIHPNESVSFYESAVGDRPYPVKVVDEDLYSYVKTADTVVTINSNVGLESMVLDTLCVCVNQWSPLIRARPYATYGPVPVLRTTEEVQGFFSGLTRTRIEELTADELDFVADSYLDGESAERIAGVLLDSSKLTEDTSNENESATTRD